MDDQGRLYALSEEKAVLLVLPEPVTDAAARMAVPVGGIKSHLFALTRNGSTAYCMNILSHTVTKVSTVDPLVPPLACHPGMKPEGCCLSDDEQTLFVSNRWSNTLSAIRTRDMVVERTVPSREDATRIYREDSENLLVTNYGDRSLSRVVQRGLEETAYLALEARPIALSLHPNKPLAFVSQDDDRVAIVDLMGMTVQRYLHTQREPDVSQVIFM
jgi:DNA-binding beta-propeller fold protein YncE